MSTQEQKNEALEEQQQIDQHVEDHKALMDEIQSLSAVFSDESHETQLKMTMAYEAILGLSYRMNEIDRKLTEINKPKEMTFTKEEVAKMLKLEREKEVSE